MLTSSEIKFLENLVCFSSNTINFLPYKLEKNKLIVKRTKERLSFYLSVILEIFLLVDQLWRIITATPKQKYAFLMIYGIAIIALLTSLCAKILLSMYLDEFLALITHGMQLNQFLGNSYELVNMHELQFYNLSRLQQNISRKTMTSINYGKKCLSGSIITFILLEFCILWETEFLPTLSLTLGLHLESLIWSFTLQPFFG